MNNSGWKRSQATALSPRILATGMMSEGGMPKTARQLTIFLSLDESQAMKARTKMPRKLTKL